MVPGTCSTMSYQLPLLLFFLAHPKIYLIFYFSYLPSLKNLPQVLCDSWIKLTFHRGFLSDVINWEHVIGQYSSPRSQHPGLGLREASQLWTQKTHGRCHSTPDHSRWVISDSSFTRARQHVSSASLSTLLLWFPLGKPLSNQQRLPFCFLNMAILIITNTFLLFPIILI